jgi:hypothetical protein
MAKEPRQSQRVNAEVPVRLENSASGVTRDISPSGVYFVIGEKLEAGQQIHFSIEFDDPGGGVLMLDCIGKVVRVEDAGGKSGVAATITQSRLERRAPDAAQREKTSTA